MGTTRVITGNCAVGWGAYLARPHVVAAYPITPQTTIIETLADLVSKGPERTRFLNVESEHSALSACVGAAFAGARAFTATSSQGLLLMHEILHWASGGRQPLVLANVNRATAPGWSIWTDQNDSLSQRDTGWMQLYVTNAQEALDAVILAYRVAEQVQVPVMVVLDAFVLSHTAEPVAIPAQPLVDEFLPSRLPVFRLDVERPAAFGGLLSPQYYQEIRQRLHEDMLGSIPIWQKASREWSGLVGREMPLVEQYRCEDAELVLVASATPSVTAEEVIDEFRAQGLPVGLLRLRLFRPFPAAEVAELLAGVSRVAVLDRDCSYGHHGIWCQELKSALYALPDRQRPQCYGYIAGLGGRDVTLTTLRGLILRTLRRNCDETETMWLRD
ncbi:MAG: pyruvate ferredoxin oxidoreductase [Armatimonadetes bacterium]|nr:pyruvate ferredoxin oxidoreductase [Armatimonadota bacterium]